LILFKLIIISNIIVITAKDTTSIAIHIPAVEHKYQDRPLAAAVLRRPFAAAAAWQRVVAFAFVAAAASELALPCVAVAVTGAAAVTLE